MIKTTQKHILLPKLNDNLYEDTYEGNSCFVFCYKKFYIEERAQECNWFEGTLKEIVVETTISEYKDRIAYGGFIARSRNDPTYVSLIYCRNDLIRRWAPSFKELFEMLKSYDDLRVPFEIIKRIKNRLEITKEFTVDDIVGSCRIDLNSSSQNMIINPYTNVSIHELALYSLIKHIMISEDITFCKPGQLGRDMCYMALVDYLKYKYSWEKIDEKYELSKINYK